MNSSLKPPSKKAALIRLEEKLGYVFNDTAPLETALTHSSWANEHGVAHNERLEFLGDAVLELVISRQIYLRFPGHREGAMTKMRSSLVSEEHLAMLAEKLRLGSALRMGRGEEYQGGRTRPALLADAMEAVFGAVFLDGGFAAAEQVILLLFGGSWSSLPGQDGRKDYKTRLQEVTQALLHSLPAYIPLESRGPEHARIFTVSLELSDGKKFLASGSSLKRAEQNAARMALDELEHLLPDSTGPGCSSR